jgi:hypothetical protein
MPIQIKRLIAAFAIFISLSLVLIYFLTPESWGEFGPYRGISLNEIANQEPKYSDKESCSMCHDSIVSLKTGGEHKSITCETCHGPGYKHVNEPEKNKMEKPEGREFCVRCHAKNAARPKNIIKQIDAIEHNKGEVCISCHNPHKP